MLVAAVFVFMLPLCVHNDNNTIQILVCNYFRLCETTIYGFIYNKIMLPLKELTYITDLYIGLIIFLHQRTARTCYLHNYFLHDVTTLLFYTPAPVLYNNVVLGWGYLINTAAKNNDDIRLLKSRETPIMVSQQHVNNMVKMC